MNRFGVRAAIVTDSAPGIGRGIALQLAAEGATVVINDVQTGDTAQAEVERGGGRAAAIRAYFGVRDAVSRDRGTVREGAAIDRAPET